MKTLRDRHGIVHELRSVKQSEMHALKMIVSYACRPRGGIIVESGLIMEQDTVDCMTCLVRDAE